MRRLAKRSSENAFFPIFSNRRSSGRRSSDRRSFWRSRSADFRPRFGTRSRPRHGVRPDRGVREPTGQDHAGAPGLLVHAAGGRKEIQRPGGGRKEIQRPGGGRKEIHRPGRGRKEIQRPGRSRKEVRRPGGDRKEVRRPGRRRKDIQRPGGDPLAVHGRQVRGGLLDRGDRGRVPDGRGVRGRRPQPRVRVVSGGQARQRQRLPAAGPVEALTSPV